MTGARRSSRFAVMIVALCGIDAAACYDYHPADVAAVHPSEIVHVVLSPEAAVALRTSIGPNASSVDGRVLSVESDRVRLAVTRIARSTGPEEFLHGEPLELPLVGTSAISVRRFDRTRTIVALTGVVASAIAAAKASDQPAIVSVRGGTGASTR